MDVGFAEEHVQSADGSPIGILSAGPGPPLVFVHGSLTTGEEWRPVAGALADRFSCHIMSRRGRGRSGDAAAYSLDKELEDIEAVLRACDGIAHLLGHSYGAVCALETARRSSIGKLVLYEPPLPIDGSIVGPVFATFRQAVAAGRLDEALATMLRDIVHVSDDQLFSLRRSPLWDQMAALTPSAKRELEVIAGLERGVDRFRAMSAPTLLLLGTETAPHHKSAVRALQHALPNARTAFLPGQGHEAHVHAPDLVAREIAEFLRAT